MEKTITPATFKVTRDVVYGNQIVNFTTTKTPRPMLLDVYEPIGSMPCDLRPAIILAFGGSFHRGSKEQDSFTAGELFNTSASEYAAHWAAQGYVCFSIDYRLAQEDPDPGTTPFLASHNSVAPDRMHLARKTLGLPPATIQMLANAVEAATDDVAMATRFVQSNSIRWGVDPSRIALWGWSAGARSVLNAVFTEGVEPAVLISVSGYMHGEDLRRNVPVERNGPNLLLIFAERDLPHMIAQSRDMIEYFGTKLPQVESLILPNVDHFYPSSTKVAAEGGEMLIDRMSDFLRRHLW
ncbi:alpha/beta hydrolase [Rhizobium sp. LEGMi135b]